MPRITLAGEDLIAQKQAALQPLNVARFIFANVPGLNPNNEVDRAAPKPPAGQIVYSAEIPPANRGYVNPSQVVYSLQVGSDVGDWDFNWIGLESAEGVLFAVAYVPLQQKRRNIPPLQIGNNITRNFLVVFDGAQALTGITIDASTWQHDFTVRLAGVDERERQSNRDVYGRACFFGTGLQLEKVGSVYQLKPGTAYVEGVRVQRSTALAVTPPAFPTTAWLDVALQRELNDVVASWSVVWGAGKVDYVDSAGVQHYCVAIADLPNSTTITDSRPVESIAGPLVKHFAPLNSPVFTGNPQVPTPAATDNDTSAASTAFVRAAMALFGLGNTAAAAISTADDALSTPNGLYVVTASAIGSPGGLTNAQGYLIHQRASVTATQLFSPGDSSNRLFIRTGSGATWVWQPWREIWHTGNLVKQTNTDDLNAGRMVLTETVRRRLTGGFFNAYCDRLILLHPLYASTLLPYSIVDGKITAARGGTNAILNQTSVEIVSTSAYNGHVTAFYDTAGVPADPWQAVSCTYQGIKYAALIVPYSMHAYGVGIFFEGRAVSEDVNQLLCIEYYNRSTATVLNAEVYNSIAPLTVQKTLRVGGESVWHTGNVSAFIQTLFDDADAAAARATLGANNASNLNAGTVPIALLPTAVRNQGQGDSTQDPNLAVHPVILSNHANTPHSSAYWHITTTFWSAIGTTSNRGQIAVSYNTTATQVWARSCFNNVWTPWVRCDGAEVAPPGKTAHFAMSTAPAGWLKANGAAISRTAYAALFAAIGTTYGAGDGSSTFNLPDLRGEFVRGWDDGRGADSGRVFGSAQADDLKSHTHTVKEGSSAPGGTGQALTSGDDYTNTIAYYSTSGATGGTETRPRNIALLACIKY